MSDWYWCQYLRGYCGRRGLDMAEVTQKLHGTAKYNDAHHAFARSRKIEEADALLDEALNES